MKTFQKVTEEPSHYNNLERMPVHEILAGINKEDSKVPAAIKKVIPQIESLINAVVDKMLTGGRLFYIGAGTSGRLGILDASECPPSFGVPSSLVNGIIAGGSKAITAAIEFAEDDIEQGWKDLQEFNITGRDVVVGIAASGTTPYVIGVLQKCRDHGILCGSISCNPGSPVSMIADFPVEVVVGPEFITGSTRMKSGTAQKLVLNMISTAVMIQLGRVEGNKMVNMQLTNEKLIDRGVQIVMEELGIADYSLAKELLLRNGSVKKTVSGGQ
ncbi:MAG: N-acetylmuramic acid 6-phosphate etherase [Ginsengibacter sp.]